MQWDHGGVCAPLSAVSALLDPTTSAIRTIFYHTIGFCAFLVALDIPCVMRFFYWSQEQMLAVLDISYLFGMLSHLAVLVQCMHLCCHLDFKQHRRRMREGWTPLPQHTKLLPLFSSLRTTPDWATGTCAHKHESTDNTGLSFIAFLVTGLYSYNAFLWRCHFLRDRMIGKKI